MINDLLGLRPTTSLIRRRAPTILVYGHYDVQPTGDLAEWATPPFEPSVAGDVIRGRGTSDDKGPVYIVVKTLQAFLAQERRLPLNVKFLFEGEEEIGSPNLPGFVARHARKLAADLVISADGAMWRPGEPSLAVASRWLVTLDITVEARTPTCTRAGTAGPSPTRCTCSARSWPACTGRTGRSRWTASATESRRCPRTAAASLRRFLLTKRSTSPNSGCVRLMANRGTRPWSGSGNGRRWRSTGSPAAGSTR